MSDLPFAQLYRLHAPSVHRRARAMLGNEADAWEVVQDIFTSLYEKPEQFSGRSRLSTYLYSATTNACLNRIRNEKTRHRLLTTRGEQVPAPEPDLPLDPESLSLLHDLLRRLPQPIAQVAMYHYVDDLSQQEIADLVGCSRRHVGHLLERVAEVTRALEASC